MPKINFTTQRIEALPTPDGKRTYYTDTKMLGLCLCCHPTGSKVFEFYRRVAGRPVRLKIDRFGATGVFGAIGVAAARKAVEELNARASKGEDITAARRQRREEPTLAKVFEAMMNSKNSRKPKTIVEYHSIYDLHLKKSIGPRRLSVIKNVDVRRLHAEIGTKHPHTANRTKSLIHALFVYAENYLGHTEKNPASGIKSYRENPRTRCIEQTEKDAFVKAIGTEPDQAFQDLVLLLINTGARKGNVMSIQRDEIDFLRGLWIIPAARTKSHKAYEIRLNSIAEEILHRRCDNVEGQYLFPPRRKGKSLHWNNVTRQWKALLKRAGIKDLRIHDLRKTFATWLYAAGTPLATISKLLCHSDISVTARVYAHVSPEQKQNAVDLMAKLLPITKKIESKVID